MILNEGQQRAVEIVSQRYKEGQPYSVLTGPAGSGKAQPVDTIIPTPNGNRLLGELKVGDYIFDRMGKPTKVLGIYPQGEKTCWEVTLKDGRKTTCAEDHLWSSYTSKNNFISKTIKEMYNQGVKTSYGFRWQIPNNFPVRYPEQVYELDPYFIGAFLGAGCCKEDCLTLSSETEEIPNIIGEIIQAKPKKNLIRILVGLLNGWIMKK